MTLREFAKYEKLPFIFWLLELEFALNIKEIIMNITQDEIHSLGAAIEQFSAIAECGTGDSGHQKHHATLVELLRKAKSYKRAKKLVATDAQIKAIHSQLTDCESMLGGGDDDTNWVRNIRNVNRMFRNNGLPIVE